MQQALNYDPFQRSIRMRVCTKCYQRPAGSERESPDVPRSCEQGCPIFMHLPRLVGIAKGNNESDLDAYEHEMREHICSTCEFSAGAGELCPENLARTCPLRRYLADVVQAIESVDQLHRSVD